MFDNSDKVRSELTITGLDPGAQELILSTILGVLLLLVTFEIKDAVIAQAKATKIELDLDPTQWINSLTSKTIGQVVPTPQQVREMIKPDDKWDIATRECFLDNPKVRSLVSELAALLLAEK